MRVELYDPFDPRVRDDPYPVYRRLRDDHPAYWCESRATWVLSRYDDVYAALQDPDTFSSAQGVFPAREPANDNGDMADALLPMLIMMDPPQHTAFRKLVSRAFTPRRVAQLEPDVQRLASELLDAVVDSGGCDLVQHVTGPLPAMVIADLLGIPREDRDKFRSWSSAMVQGDPLVAGERTTALEAAGSLYNYFADVIDERRRRPGEDLVSALVQAEVDGQRLSDEQLLGFCLLLLVAGHETTTNLLSNAAVHLAEHRDERARLHDEQVLEHAPDELLRYDSSVQALSRTLTRDVTLHGELMRTGQPVLLLFGSANRDERAYAQPDRLDLTRRPDNHLLAFGHGIHFCLGAALARLEIRITLREMVRRIPDWNIDTSTPPARLRSGPIRGFSTLHISW